MPLAFVDQLCFCLIFEDIALNLAIDLIISKMESISGNITDGFSEYFI